MTQTIKLASKEICTGCAVCHDVCAKGAITMSSDGALHAFPVINTDKCINCGRCEKVCPIINFHQQEKHYTQRYLYSWTTNLEERMKSTSGGTGSALMRLAMKEGYYVCAPIFDEELNLHHKLSEITDDITLFRGSKYLQSDTAGCYKEIIDKLRQGEKVFFIGTPCQIAAFNAVVPIKYIEQTLTCAIICHGVNSSLVWKDYKNYLQTKEKSSITAYNFRSKSHGWQKKRGGENLRVAYEFASGRAKDVPSWNNLFHTWFGQHYILRPSCLNCLFRREERYSDVTIGDFWNIEKIVPGISTKEGITALILSSQKGEDFINRCEELYKDEVTAKDALSGLKGYVDKTSAQKRKADIEKNKLFEKEYLSCSFEEMAKKYPYKTVFKYYWDAIRSKLK